MHTIYHFENQKGRGGGPKYRREDNIKMYLERTDCENVEWIRLVRDCLRMTRSIEHGIEPSGSVKCGNCHIISVPISF